MLVIYACVRDGVCAHAAPLEYMFILVCAESLMRIAFSWQTLWDLKHFNENFDATNYFLFPNFVLINVAA